MALTDALTLNNGVTIPQLGFGTWKVNADEAERIVREALDVGYRHIDTAMIYQNEREVGRAIRGGGVPRDELFVTTKCWTVDMRAGKVIEACETSLRALGLDHVDLYLLHWAVGDIAACWRQMHTLLERGKARAIGVSNFMVPHLEQLPDPVPAVNQVEFHPYLQSPELIAYCGGRGIVCEAWRPIMGGNTDDVDTLRDIAARHGKTSTQVTLRWQLQRGMVAIPKTTRRQRMAENAGVFDFQLTAEEVAAIDALDRNQRQGADPNNVPF